MDFNPQWADSPGILTQIDIVAAKERTILQNPDGSSYWETLMDFHELFAPALDEGYPSRISLEDNSPADSTPTHAHYEGDVLIDEGYSSVRYSGSSGTASTRTSRSFPKYIPEAPRRRLCPVISCVRRYQKKGYFVNHFVSKHIECTVVNTKDAAMDPKEPSRLLKIQPCDDCKGALLKSAATLADHIWTHMSETGTKFDQPHPNSPAPSPLWAPWEDLLVASGLRAAPSSKQTCEPTSKFDNVKKERGNLFEQSIEIGSTQIHTKPVHDQIQLVETRSPSPSSSTSKHEGTQTRPCVNASLCASVPQEITHWVDATRDLTSVLSEPPSIWSPPTTFVSPSIATHAGLLNDEDAMISSKALLFELLEILQDRHEELNIDDASSAVFSSPQDPESSVTNGSASDASYNSNSISGIVPAEAANKRSYPPNDSPSDGEDGGGPPRKKPNREQNPLNLDTPSSKGRCKRIPCTQRDCLGTDEEISLLLRSLIQHHRIVICPNCCTRLEVKAEEKPEDVWKLHKAEQCERRCISQTCSGIDDDTFMPHRRTPNCSSWRALNDEDKWAFIYTLANPGEQPPSLEISEGAGLRHSRERIPRQPKKRTRGTEIVETLAKSIEAKDRQIMELESDLKAASERNAHLQQRYDDKRNNQENIIWTLMERLADNNISIPPSIQARLNSHCPELMKQREIISMLYCDQVLPPTPSVTPHVFQRQILNTAAYIGQETDLDNFNFDKDFPDTSDLATQVGSSSS